MFDGETGVLAQKLPEWFPLVSGGIIQCNGLYQSAAPLPAGKRTSQGRKRVHVSYATLPFGIERDRLIRRPVWFSTQA
jgi:hypothetical protein